MKNQKKKSFPRRVFLCLLAVLLAVCIAFGIYVSDYYHTDPAAEDALVSDDVVSVTEQNGNWVFAPESPTTETIIDGGCHAGFGSYGAQKGDGTPTISAEEQQQQTADALAAWMNLQ